MSNLPLNEEQQKIQDWLKANNFREPTTKDFLTYIQAYNKYGRSAIGPYYEDVHYAWSQLGNNTKT